MRVAKTVLRRLSISHILQLIIFGRMNMTENEYIVKEQFTIHSKSLKREVAIEMFLPKTITEPNQLSLLLINDGQDMPLLHFDGILHRLYRENAISPLCCAAIACGNERMMEYGVAGKKDYLGRGAKAKQYTSFILKELLPCIKKRYKVPRFRNTSFAGFSLGGLSALDIVWNHPGIFTKVGVFSGSLWWRSKDQLDRKYDDDKHRIMQQVIRKGKFAPGLEFFFQTGKLDETADRNNNGIIDAIEDTLDHIHELIQKGYAPHDIAYLELEDGRHDVPTWGRAMPVFLKWGWGKEKY